MFSLDDLILFNAKFSFDHQNKCLRSSDASLEVLWPFAFPDSKLCLKYFPLEIIDIFVCFLVFPAFRWHLDS